MKYTLRSASEDDVQPMMHIGHEGLRPHVEPLRGWNEEAEKRGFLEHFEIDRVQVILVDGAAVGYVKCVDHNDHRFVDGIYIAASYRGGGLGTAVLSNMLAESDRPVRLRVHKTNPARRLYERLGFLVIGETDEQYVMARS